MRKLASIRKIDELRPIPGADAIECALVGGWTVVVKKGEFAAGDLAVYCEIDSWIPVDLAPFLVKGKEPREFEGIKGERLRSIKLRGQLSQGLLLPIDHCIAVAGCTAAIQEGDEWTEHLGIVKWEKAIPAQLAGQVRGNFPTAIPKTDQERCQNLTREIAEAASMGMAFEVTEKLEGSSMTCYLIEGEFGVCSRNLDLKRDENNTFWATAIACDIERKMRDVADFTGMDFAIQGELIGPGIQGNIYELTQPAFYVFDVYNVTGGKYLLPETRRRLIDNMQLNHVPVIDTARKLTGQVSELLNDADGPTYVNGQHAREGLVYKQVDGGMTFKAISNVYLLGEK